MQGRLRSGRPGPAPSPIEGGLAAHADYIRQAVIDLAPVYPWCLISINSSLEELARDPAPSPPPSSSPQLPLDLSGMEDLRGFQEDSNLFLRQQGPVLRVWQRPVCLCSLMQGHSSSCPPGRPDIPGRVCTGLGSGRCHHSGGVGSTVGETLGGQAEGKGWSLASPEQVLIPPPGLRLSSAKRVVCMCACVQHGLYVW